MKKVEIKVIRNYSFWRHPIKWWKDRKPRALLEMYLNHRWDKDLEQEVEKMLKDVFLNGSTTMDNKV